MSYILYELKARQQQLALVTHDSDMLQKQACSAFVYRCLHVAIYNISLPDTTCRTVTLRIEY